MQKFVSKYGLAAHLAILAVAPLFLFPFFRSTETAIPLLWLSLIGAIWTIMEPSRRSNEMLHDARCRVRKAIVKDPIFWVLAAIVVLGAIRWANTGVARAFDFNAEGWILKSPSVKILPGSVKGCGLLPFSVALSVLVIVSACRHALGKGARVCFLFTSSLLASIAALTTIVLVKSTAADSIINCSLGLTLPETSFLGSSYGVFLLAGVAAITGMFELGWNKQMPLLIISIGGTLAGLYFFAPAFTIAVFLASSIFLLLVAVGYISFVLNGISAFKCVSVVLIAVGIPALFILWASPDGLFDARTEYFKTGKLFSDNYEALRAMFSDMAFKSWLEHKWIGAGVGAFPLEFAFKASPEDWAALASVGIHTPTAAPLNGWWMLLCERGLLGGIMLVVLAVLMLVSFVRRLIGSIKRRCRVSIPTVILGPLAVGAIVAEAFFDSSIQRPEIFIMAAALFSLAISSFPQPKVSASAESHPAEEKENGR